MSNRNRKAKGTTMVDKKLAKAKERIENLEQRLQAAQMQVLNMRQMYEGSIQEKQGLQAQLTQARQIVVGAALQARKGLTLRAKTFEKLNDYVGYDLKSVDGDLIVTPLSRKDVEEMEDFLADDEEEETDEQGD